MDYDYNDFDYNIPKIINEELIDKINQLKKSPYYPFYLICSAYKFGYNEYGGVYCIMNCYEDGWRLNPIGFETPTPNNTAPGCPLYAAYLDMTNKFRFEEIINYTNQAAEYFVKRLNKNSEIHKKYEKFYSGLGIRERMAFSRECQYNEEINSFGTDFREFDDVIYDVANCSDGLEYLKI